MKVGEMNGFEFHVPTSGGKAGKGRHTTSTIQIRRGNQIVKQIRFTLSSPESRTAAVLKAKEYVNEASKETPA